MDGDEKRKKKGEEGPAAEKRDDFGDRWVELRRSIDEIGQSSENGFLTKKKRKGDGRWRLVRERDVKRNSFLASFEKQSRERKRGSEESSSFV